MTININKITTEITLELDQEQITLTNFTKAVDSFLGIVREVTKESLPQKSPSGWLIKVYEGSAGIGVLRNPTVFTKDEEYLISNNILNGLNELESGSRHPKFNDKAIEYSRTLSKVFSDKKNVGNLRLLITNKKPFSITNNIAIKASALLDPVYEDDGSVEGMLEKLSAHGQFEFVLYDVLDNRAIKCEVEEEQLKEAWAAWRDRVEVIGTVRYRHDGLPVSIKARTIIPFPKRDDLPSLDDVRKLFGEA